MAKLFRDFSKAFEDRLLEKYHSKSGLVPHEWKMENDRICKRNVKIKNKISELIKNVSFAGGICAIDRTSRAHQKRLGNRPREGRVLEERFFSAIEINTIMNVIRCSIRVYA